MRDEMIDDDQVFDADYYDRKDKTVDIENDIPEPFLFSYPEDKGKKAEDTSVVPDRRNTGESLIIETDSEIDFKPDDIVVINGLSYNITAEPLIRNSAYDLKALRGGSNITKVLIMDK